MKLEYRINNEDKTKYSTIHSILKDKLHISNRLLTKLINKHYISINNSICDTRNSFEVNDLITINLDYSEYNSNIIATQMNLDIVYEDEWFLIVNKPAGIPIHPSLSHYTDSLSNGIKYYFDSIGLHKKIRPVNRLDSYTSRISNICKMFLHPGGFEYTNA